MLDEQDNITSDDLAPEASTEVAAPAPRRRRRAASRPSGPPAPVAAPEPVAAAPEVDETPAEPEVEAQPEVVAQPEVEAQPETVAQPELVAEPETVADAPIPEAPAETVETPTEPVEEPAAAESDAAPAAPEVTEVAEQPVIEDLPEAAAEQDTTVEEVPAPVKRVRKTTARKRVVREAGAPHTRRRSNAIPAEEDDVPVETPTTATAAPAASTPPAEVDELGARLRAAAEAAAGRVQQAPRRGRRVSGVVANPFGAAAENDDPQAVLQSLAASIAGTTHSAPVQQKPDEDDVVAQDAVVEDDAPAAEVTTEQDTETSETDVEVADAVDQAATDDSTADETTDDTAADESDSDDSEDDSDDSDDDSPRRRRRRRGGRRRRRGTDSSEADSDEDTGESAESDDADSSEESSTDDSDGASAASTETSDSSDGSDDDSGDSSGRRRRRRRRRRGEDTGSADDDPTDVVVRVREPRAPRSSNDEITGIEGSTRLEAKRQRRRDGRAAGRRRAPILSEAEFLARRESVKRTMLVRQRDDYNQIAVLEDDILVEHYVDRASATSLIGNVYLGRIQNVLPSMEAAFIDIGRGRNAVLYAGEVDWDGFGAQGSQRKIEQVFKSGQTVLVQVSKDPVGAKGARLTSHISIPGRYVVYSPGGQLSGISRKLADAERHRLKDILGSLIDEDASVIVRTAAEGASEDELIRDVTRLKAQWESIEKKVKQGSAPQLLYSEPAQTVRIVRDLFTEDFAELVIQGRGGTEDVGDAIVDYVEHVAPHLADRVQRWDAESGDVFTKYRVDEQISKALERKVFLPSGGSLVIDRTEAMTVIDVNTGRFTGTAGNLEATVTSNNLEAAEEVVRQLRLRDIGGIIVIDFIDMVLPANRELLIRRLTECLARDRTRHQVAEVSSLGLVQMTRKKIGTGLAEAFTEECTHCGGRGYHRSVDPVESQSQADGGDRRGRNSGHSSGHSSGGGGNSNSGGSGSTSKAASKDVSSSDASASASAGASTGSSNDEQSQPRRRRASRRATRPEGASTASTDD